MRQDFSYPISVFLQFASNWEVYFKEVYFISKRKILEKTFPLFGYIKNWNLIIFVNCHNPSTLAIRFYGHINAGRKFFEIGIGFYKNLHVGMGKLQIYP